MFTCACAEKEAPRHQAGDRRRCLCNDRWMDTDQRAGHARSQTNYLHHLGAAAESQPDKQSAPKSTGLSYSSYFDVLPMSLADLFDVVQKPASLPDVRLTFDPRPTIPR
jgi:hypothetical protein